MITPMADPSEIQAAKVVDARGRACPGPLLEAKKGIGGYDRIFVRRTR